jgi:hypothetical protein
MSCARVNEVREPELLYAPEPLKGPRLENTPEYALNLRSLDIEFDKIVQRVPDTLLLGHSNESPRHAA